MDFGFGIIGLFSSLMFTLVPLMIMGVGVFMLVTFIKTKRYNASQPRLTVKAKLVAKRTNVNHGMNDQMHQTHTSYYATFEVESGDRMELRVPGQEYGMLVEGDEGQLSFQGYEFQGFSRNRV